MDYSSEVVNITKIKDGFFLGDEATASNLDVIIQFKITHMVNAAGSQIINAWESIGIKYLTLNWSENSNQNLFDQKDEIANRIVNFIDDSFKNGEGLLVHSLRGQNRACLVVILFRWTLAKSLDFLTNKKFDVEIPKYFLSQLSFFESRLCKIGMGPKTSTWQENGNDNDPEEVLIRNTYVNGLVQKNEKIDNKTNFTGKKIVWADNNNFNNKSLLCSSNIGKDLVLQKELKPVMSHKKLKPNKSCLKKTENFGVGNINFDIKKSNSQVFTGKLGESHNLNNFNNLNSNITNLNNTVNVGSSLSNINSIGYTNNGNTQDRKLTSSVNFSENSNFKPISLVTNSNDLLKNYTNLGNIYNMNNNEYITGGGSSGLTNGSRVNNTPNDINYQIPNLKNSHLEKTNYSLDNNLNSSYNPNISNMNIGVQNSSHNLSQQNLSQNTNKPNLSSYTANPVNRQNNFTMNNPNQTGLQAQRSYSLGPDKDRNTQISTNIPSTSGSANLASNQQAETKIIIASKYKNVVHNSYNNIYIQNPEDLDKIYTGNNINPTGSNSSHTFVDVPNVSQHQMTSNFGTGSNNIPLINKNPASISNPSQGKLTKSGENQRMLQNNFFTNSTVGTTNTQNIIDYNKLKVIDYSSNSSTQNRPPSYKDYSQTYNQQNKLSNKGTTLNNYQPELNKKNLSSSLGGNNNQLNLLNRQNPISKQGPIKIQSDYDKKPSTPDNTYTGNNISTVKINSGINSTKNISSTPSNYGIIKRSGSKQKTEDRPSTAPQKENEKAALKENPSLKRLPSPNLRSGMGSSVKNISLGPSLAMGQSISYSKYRSPSPSTISKPSTITLGSLKSNGVGKPKWK